MKRYAISIISVLALFGLGCELPTKVPAGSGSLTIAAAEASGSASARNLFRWTEPAATYRAVGAGPDAASFDETWNAGDPATIDQLAPGTWTFTVDSFAANASPIARGSGSATVVSGQTASAVVLMSYIAGTGSISFQLDWEEGVDIATANGTLQVAGVGDIPMTFSYGTRSAACTVNEVPAGNGHSFNLQALTAAGNPAYGTNGTIHVTNGQVSIVALHITDGQASAPPGTPAGVTAIPGTFCVDLAWTDVAGEDGYFVERRPAGGAWGCLTPGLLAADSAAYRDITAAPTTTYDYRISAYNSRGEATSAVSTTTTPVFSDAIVRSPVAIGDDNGLRVLADGTVKAYGGANYYQFGRNTKEISVEGIIVNGLSNIISVKCSAWSQCFVAIDRNGDVWSWGSSLSSESLPKKVSGLGRPIIDIRVGERFFIALDADGAVWTWGSNSDGTLGNGTTTSNSTPAIVLGLPKIRSIAAGGRHVLAAATDGRLFVWGDNYHGQLGIGNKNNKLSPELVSSITTANRVIACNDVNTYTSFVILTDGTVMAAGYSFSSGLGLPNSEYISFTAVPGLTNILDLVSLPYCTIALDAEGALYGSGSSSNGILLAGWPDLGTWAFTAIPGAPTGVTSMTVSADSFYCETGGGAKYAWGNNTYGELMLGTGAVHPLPATVSTPATLKQMVGGDDFLLAIDDAGDIWAWGANKSGQIGDGTTTARATPVKILDAAAPAVQVAAYGSKSMALLSDGSIYTWGGNASGTFPVKNTDTNLSSGVVEVALGSSHWAVRKSDGSVWTWGSNSYGQLGDDTGTYKASAVQVKSVDGLGYLTGVASLAATKYNCIARLTDGTVVCWGSYWDYLLGNLSSAHALRPVFATGLTAATAVFVGPETAFAFQNDIPYKWGNMHGVIWGVPENYNPSYAPQITPVKMMALNIDIYPTAIAVRADNVVRTGGYNDHGQAGDGTITSPSFWITPSGPTGTIVSVACTKTTSAALSSIGTLWTWGSNAYGQLGNGSIDPDYFDTPQLLPW
jgi:alpha-tubulin suppressor-like RCC1 family protein